jgi:hypothetical protein
MSTPYAGADTFPATIPLPDDSVDKRNASTINACFGPLMDAVRWLKNRLGAKFAMSPAIVTNTATGQIGTDATSASFRSPPNGTDDVELVAVGSLQVGDRYEFNFTFHAVGDAVDKTGEYRIMSVQNGTEVEPNAHAQLSLLNVTGANTKKYALTICGGVDVAHAGTMYLYLQARSPDGTTAFRIYGPYSGFTKIWRPT